jgi:hypothetical protein
MRTQREHQVGQDVSPESRCDLVAASVGCGVVHSSRRRDRPKSCVPASTRHESSRRYCAVSRWSVSASLHRVPCPFPAFSCVPVALRQGASCCVCVECRASCRVPVCVRCVRSRCVSVAAVPQRCTESCTSPRVAIVAARRPGEGVPAYRRAARPPRGGSAKAATAVSPALQSSSWVALRDVVGALMSAIRPPASPDKEGPSREKRRRR